MKRIQIIAGCLVLVAGLFLFTVPVWAQTENAKEPQQIEQEILDASDAQKLVDGLPDETKDFFEEHQLDDFTSDSMLSLSGGDLVKIVWEGITQKLNEPLAVLAMVLGVVLLSALLGSFEETFEGHGLGKVFQVVSVLCISGILIAPVVQVIKQTIQLIQQVGEFLLGFIPVYAGIIAVSGKPASAFAYNSMLVGTVQLVSGIAAQFLIPLCCIYLALCLTGSVSDSVQIGGLTKSLKTVSMWVLGFLLTIFVAILTIKGFVAGSADSVSLRAGKYLVSSFVPMVGGAISDALTVLQSSVGVIRSTVGAFGILAVLLCFLPGIVSILLMSAAVKIAQIVSEMLAVKKVSALLEATGFVLGFLQSILISYGIMVIVSVSLMLVLGLSL